MDEDGCDSMVFYGSKYMVIEELKGNCEMASCGYAAISDIERASPDIERASLI